MPSADVLDIVRVAPEEDWRDLLAGDVQAGFASHPKRLPARWLYDERGADLFEQITRLPEYYLTRAEVEILDRVAHDLVTSVAPDEIVELGSGSSRKTGALLDPLRAAPRPLYVALDVSEASLRAAALALRERRPWLAVRGVVGDFHRDLAAVPRSGRRLVAFLGSTIGNLDEGERARLLRRVRASLEPGDAFLLGVDLVKDGATLLRAYDDAAGVTAEFNRNVIAVLNRGLGARLPPEAFAHAPRWNAGGSRIEMWLRATRPLESALPRLGTTVTFAQDEELHTEISCKFTRAGIERELEAAGLSVERWEEDDAGRFALLLARPR